MTSRGVIREYIPPMGGHTTLAVIDSVGTGMRIIPVDQSQIHRIMKDFPPGSEVILERSGRDDRYIFRKPLTGLDFS